MQLTLFGSQELSERIAVVVAHILQKRRQPSARELLDQIENALGLEARWDLKSVVRGLSVDPKQTRANRQYLKCMIDDGSLGEALRGDGAPDHEVVSTIDALIHQSMQYRSSTAFKKMIEFMGRFRNYAPYNNMLVYLQNPSCSFYATVKDWQSRFGRTLKEDAQPMLILAPMHPVMLVYDLDETEGEKLPAELTEFAHFEGEWYSDWLFRTIENAKRHRIRVDFKQLSTTHGGFATFAREIGVWKMRIVVHDELDESSRFGVLCHELAHIFLGHLGTDYDHWWPSRSNLERDSVEIEAEAVAYIVTSRLGLMGSSAAYVSRYLKSSDIPAGVSLDMIAKVAGKVERMARKLMPRPRPKKRPR